MEAEIERENGMRSEPIRYASTGVPTDSRQLASRVKAKSSLRLKYEAESHLIERKLGSLEAIRASLGLSQRKIAQLLLVDPSAWTRWTKGDDQAPPHIYRMLQWYLALEEKYPALDVNFWLNSVAQVAERTQILEQSEKSLLETDRRLTEITSALAKQRADSDLQNQASTRSVIETKIALSERERSVKRWIIVALAVACLAGVAIGAVTVYLLR